jgi:hypothetical protein
MYVLQYFLSKIKDQLFRNGSTLSCYHSADTQAKDRTLTLAMVIMSFKRFDFDAGHGIPVSIGRLMV